MNEQAQPADQAGAAGSVRKSVTVPREQRAAFRLWTEQIHRWWPAGHSISGDPATRVILEGRRGGRFYERTAEGVEHDWGRVLLWQPPDHLIFHWYLGSGPQLPTRVEVRFVPLDDQTTEVHVEHRGPDLIGDLWQRNVARYQKGWGAVLAELASFARGESEN